MANTLTKQTAQKYFPEQLAQPAQPYRPARAAWTEKKTETVCQWVQITPDQPAQTVVGTERDEHNNIIRYYLETIPAKAGKRERRCETVTTIILHSPEPEQPFLPAVGYQPASVRTDYNLGWNASARSIASLPGAAVYKFKVPGSVGVVTGLTTQDTGPTYADIPYGIYAAGSQWQVLEYGVPKTPLAIYAPSDVFKIARSGYSVTYSVNSTVVYRSTAPSAGEVFVDAALYSGGDSIDSPSLKAEEDPYETATLVLEQLRAYAGDAGAEGEQVDAVLAALTADAADGTPPETATVVLRALQALAGEYVYEEAQLALEPLEAASLDGLEEPPYEVCTAVMMPMYCAAICIEGELSSVDTTLHPIVGMAGDYAYEEMRADLGMLSAWATEEEVPDEPTEVEPTSTLTPPTGVLTARAESAPGGVALRPAAGVLRIASNNATAALRGVRPTLAFAATGEDLAQLAMTAPAATLSFAATVGDVVTLSLTAPRATQTAGGSAALPMTAPRATLKVTATAGEVASLSLAGRAGVLSFSAAGEATATLAIRAPMATTATNRATLGLTPPRARLVLVSLGDTTVAADELESYVVNLRTNYRAEPDSTSAGYEMTRYVDFPVTQLVRHNNRTYGVGPGGLYCLDAECDPAGPVHWRVTTCTTDFGGRELRRPVAMYVGGRLGPTAYFTARAGEGREFSYGFGTPRGQTAQNHRQVLGKGLRSRFFSFGIGGTGACELTNFEIETATMERRI